MPVAQSVRQGSPRARRLSVRTGAAVASALFATLVVAGCQTTSKSTTDMLSAAGFSMKLADTPAKQAALAALPANTVTIRQVKGKPVFLYADPKGCNCVYAGNETNYQTYQGLAFDKSVANQQLLAAQMNQEASWDFGAWGAWGPGWWW